MMLRLLNERDIPTIFAIEQNVQIAPWTFETFEHCLRAGYVGWVVEWDKQIVGFLLMSLQGYEGHVLNLCIDTEFQHRGLGRALILNALEAAKEKNINIVILEVRRSNIQAIALYQKLDFIQIGERKNYYPKAEGREDALVFAKDLAKTIFK